MRIELGSGRVYFAPANTPPPAEPRPIPWADVGVIAAGSLTVADLADVVLHEPVPPLTGRTFTTSITARVTPEMFRLVVGHYPLRPRRIRALTRRKYRARARRKG